MLVSIIIPVYNVADFIGDCLESVYNQTFDDIEVILVNDCTPDNSMEVAKPFIDKLRRRYKMQIICHEQNKGLSAARNTGIKSMTGDWIYLLDSDDEILPNCIKLFADKVIFYKEVDFVIGGMAVIGTNCNYPLRTSEFLSKNKDIITDYIYGRWYVMACNKLINREFFIENNLWFKEGLLHEDELFSFFLAMKSHSMACIYENTYVYKIRNANSITSQKTIVNFVHYLYINKKKLEYLYMIANQDDKIPYCRLAINTSYNFLLDVAGSKNISSRQKKDLFLQFKEIFHLEKLNLSNENLIIKIKARIVSSDYRLALIMCSIHSTIIRCKIRIFF